MAVYATQVQIADIIVRFESDLEKDISNTSRVFRYHHVDYAGEPDCTVVLKRQVSFHMPKDAVLEWQSQCHGIVGPPSPEKQIGRRRIRITSKIDAFGVASCYVSRSRGEYYYGMMQDQSWICYHPAERRIDYVIHEPHKRYRRCVANAVGCPISAIPLLLHVITTIHGRFLVHGAAVAVDGKASLFLGKSGSGKSTLSTDMAKHKASFMGDDLVFVYEKDAIPMVGSLLFPAKLHIDNPEEKRYVDVPKEMDTDYCLSAPLKAVYLVRQSGLPTSTVESRSAAELLQQLMDASNGMIMQYDRHQWLATMYDISERIPYFYFHFGDRSTLATSLLKIS